MPSQHKHLQYEINFPFYGVWGIGDWVMGDGAMGYERVIKGTKVIAVIKRM